MTDPNVGFSIYIPDRERERIELERRKQAGKASASIGPTARRSTVSVPSGSSVYAHEPKKDETLNNLEISSVEEAKSPTDEELFASQLSMPIVSVSNVTADDIPWKSKYMLELAESHRSICDQCGRCDGYVMAVKTPGKCASCSCDLIHHLKAVELDRKEEDSSDTDEEEWEDDDEEDGPDSGDDPAGDDYDDDDDDDDDGARVEPELDFEVAEKPSNEDDEGGEDGE